MLNLLRLKKSVTTNDFSRCFQSFMAHRTVIFNSNGGNAKLQGFQKEPIKYFEIYWEFNF